MSAQTDAVKTANDALQRDPKAAKSTKAFGQAITNWIVGQAVPVYSIQNLAAPVRTLDVKATSIDQLAAFAATVAKDLQS